jgi:hypothetical protein
MVATNFKTENNTFRKLIGNGLTYRIPAFQRDYSWGEEEWEDLWRDLADTLAEGVGSGHYMGYLVLQTGDDKQFEVIDGQQRMTTISILVLAVLKALQRLIEAGQQPDQNRQRAEQLRSSYVGFLDPVTLVAQPKLTLNRNNDGYWKSHLVPLGPLPQARLRASELLLRKAFEWFDRKVAERFRNAQDPGRELADFLEKAADRLFFTVVTVADELNAYRVFETLNARGVRLSATDLLKNWLFSLSDCGGASQHELASLADRWEVLVGRLGEENFSEYLRVQWNSRHPATRDGALFKTIRNEVRDRSAVFQLLREMEEDLDHFLALQKPESSHWAPELREHAKRLRQFRVTRQVPMLMAARRRFSDVEFARILRASVVIALRYNVICGYSTGEQERTYNDVALGIARGQLGSADAVVDALRSIYPADAAFRAAFAEKSLRTTQARNLQVVRYILCAIERHHEGSSELEETSESFGIEHVLPQSPGSEWVEFSPADIEAFVDRLGNMTLLESKANHRLGNAGWASKQVVLAHSEFGLSRKIAGEAAEWSPERIAAHQLWLAKQATAIWRVERLS